MKIRNGKSRIFNTEGVGKLIERGEEVSTPMEIRGDHLLKKL